MVAEQEVINGIVTGASGIGIGFIIGWGLKKAIKAVIKIAAVIMGVFFSALLYMQTQGFLTMHWDKISEASGKTVTNLANATLASSGITGTEGAASGFFNNVVTTLGVPMTGGLGIGFVFGFMRG